METAFVSTLRVQQHYSLANRAHLLLHCPLHDTARQQCLQLLDTISHEVSRRLSDNLALQLILGVYPDYLHECNVAASKSLQHTY